METRTTKPRLLNYYKLTLQGTEIPVDLTNPTAIDYTDAQYHTQLKKMREKIINPPDEGAGHMYVHDGSILVSKIEWNGPEKPDLRKYLDSLL